MVATTDVTPIASREPPLVVDMDGTLVATNTLFEGVAQLLRQRPLLGFALPFWLLRGRSAFKRAIADRVALDTELLPYEPKLVELLESARAAGREVVLCTAADHRFAQAVAHHLGLFDEVIALDDSHELTSRGKPRALVERYGAGGFDYVGSDVPDLGVFAVSRRAILVNPTHGLRRRLTPATNVEQTLAGRREGPLAAHLRAMRPHDWVKNLLVFVPVLATFTMSLAAELLAAGAAFVAFSLVASSVYLLNDVFDLDADRRHPRKRQRPFAAGTLPIEHGLAMIPLLLVGGFLIAASLPPLFIGVLLLYFVSSTLYTLKLKRVPLLDTLLLAGLYTLRVIAGAAAIAVVPSAWLLAFSMFFFLSLALAKRHSELVQREATSAPGSVPGREYKGEDLTTLISQGSASGYAAVLVLALYIDGSSVREHYNHPEIIWLICPLLLYWINKLWLNSQRRQIHEDPLIWAVTNRVSRAVGILSVILLLLARLLPPFH